MQLFYNAIREDFVDLDAVANSLITMQREVISFGWPNDTAFNEWKDKFVSLEKIEEDDEVEDDDEEGTKIKVTLAVDDEDKENPQIKESLQIVRDESSLSNLMATYSKELE